MDPNATTEPPAGTTPPATEPPKPADPAAAAMATDAGKKALDELRAHNKELAAQLKQLQERDPVKAIAEALGVKPSTEPDAMSKLAEQVQQLQKSQRDAELKATRLEVAAEKGLTPAQAARLRGNNRAELEADAEELKALFPAPTGTTSTTGTPAPDPSQGARGGGIDPHTATADALAKGDVMGAIRAQQGLLEAARSKQQ